MLILCEEKGGDRMNLFFFRNRSLAGSQNEKHQPGGTGGRSGSRDHNLHMEGTASGGDRSGDDSWNYAFADWDVDKGTPG